MPTHFIRCQGHGQPCLRSCCVGEEGGGGVRPRYLWSHLPHRRMFLDSAAVNIQEHSISPFYSNKFILNKMNLNKE